MERNYEQVYFLDKKNRVFCSETIEIRESISGLVKTIKKMLFQNRFPGYKKRIQQYLFTKKRKTLASTCLIPGVYLKCTCAVQTRRGS